MKFIKHLFFVLSIVTVLPANANHEVGGELYFECLGNNKYKFVLKMWRDCVNNQTWLGPSRWMYGPNDTVILKRDSLVDLTYQCLGPGGGGCGSTTFTGGSEMAVFSDTITLQGKPPATGWIFTVTASNSPAGVVNKPSNTPYAFKCTMYPSTINGGCNTAPHYLSNPIQPITRATKSISVLVHKPHIEDSIYYDFYNSLSYNPGYSYTSPFPNPATNSINSPITINHQTGLVEFNVQSGGTGWYVYEVAAEQWRNGQLLSKVNRLSHTYGNFTVASPVPNVTIDTSQFNMIRSGNEYKLIAFVGDTLNFVMNAINTGRYVRFTAMGTPMTLPWNPSSSFASEANAVPVAPQASLENFSSSNIRFNWLLQNEHVKNNRTSHFFNFQFFNRDCPTVGVSNISLEVEVRHSVYLADDTLRLCQGDSVKLIGQTRSNTFLWTAKNSLYSSSDTLPVVVPSASTMYYLTDPLFPSMGDSIYVEVTPNDTFSLRLVNNLLTLTDSNYTTNRIWYYNNIPFSYPFDTLPPFALGDYFVEAQKENCRFMSDTVSVTTGVFTSVFNPFNGNFFGNQLPISGSMGVTFQVSQGQNVLTTTIPGVRDVNGKTGGYDLNLKIYDSAQVEIFKMDTTLVRPITGLITLKTPVQLKPLRDYTVAITGDTGYVFSLIEGVSFPYTPYNNGVTVISGTEGAALGFPAQSSLYMLPICLTYDKDVSLLEIDDASFNLYPNPGENHTVVSGISHAQSISLFNVNGEEVFRAKPEGRQTDYTISRNGMPSGIYFLKVKYNEKEVVRKLVWY